MSAPSKFSQSSTENLPTPGTEWLPGLQIDRELPDLNGSGTWEGHDKKDGSKRLLRSARAADEEHSKALSLLCSLGLHEVAVPLARVTVGQRVIEVIHQPEGIPLMEWRNQLGTPEEEQVCTLLSGLLAALNALHLAGLVHLCLKPENILVHAHDSKVEIKLGGLDLLTVRDQKTLVPVSIDPLYAPPEAAGLYRHQAGENLERWDFWSLGRCLQEFILGAHVLGLVLDRDISRMTPELKEQAMQFIQERLPGHSRAGGVEEMKNLSPRLRLLLQGLLSGAPDARWTQSECRAWLEGKSPVEHYQLPNKQRCFRFAGEAHTVAEAATALQDDAHWDSAADNLFHPDKKETLAGFIQDHGTQPQQEKLASSLLLLDERWFKGMERKAIQEVLTAIVLLNLAGGKLVWRGQHLDQQVARDMLAREDGGGFWLHCLQIFCSPPVLGLLDKMDTEAERILGDIGHHAEKATEKAVVFGWLKKENTKELARLWQCACDTKPHLGIVKDMHVRFACSAQKDVEDLFKKPIQSNDELLLLVYMNDRPQAFGFITHEDWAKRRYAELLSEGNQIAELLFWKRLKASLMTGPWWFGRVWWLILAWGGIALAVAIIKPGPLWLGLGMLPALLALGLRLLLVSWLQPLMKMQFPKAAPWRFLDGPARCSAGVQGHPFADQSLRELETRIVLINDEIDRLAHLNPKPEGIQPPPKFRTLRLAASASWLVLAGLALFCVWQARIHPPSLEGLRQAWAFSPAEPEQEKPKPAKKIEWTYKAPSEMRSPAITGTRSPSPEEQKLALNRGRALLAKFIPDTINAAVLIQLPSEKGYLFALYDGKKDALASKNLIQLSYVPMPRNWLEIDGKKVYVYTE